MEKSGDSSAILVDVEEQKEQLDVMVVGDGRLVWTEAYQL